MAAGPGEQDSTQWDQHGIEWEPEPGQFLRPGSSKTGLARKGCSK